ncbi:MAG: hypothetical protein R2867_06240 [Caldilineaceae bacterium]
MPIRPLSFTLVHFLRFLHGLPTDSAGPTCADRFNPMIQLNRWAVAVHSVRDS